MFSASVRERPVTNNNNNDKNNHDNMNNNFTIYTYKIYCFIAESKCLFMCKYLPRTGG